MRASFLLLACGALVALGCGDDPGVSSWFRWGWDGQVYTGTKDCRTTLFFKTRGSVLESGALL